MPVPFTFANQTGPLPLSELDANFASIPDLANTANTVINHVQANITTLGTLTALNVAGNILSNGSISTSSTLTSTGNLTTTAGLVASNMYIDNNSIGNAIITGNLTVRGTLTSINSANVSTNNLVIQVANNVANTNLAQLNGAGIVAGLSDYAGMLFNALTNSWQFNIGLTPLSNVAGLNLGTTSNYWNTVYATRLITSGNIISGNITSNIYKAVTVSATSNIVGGNILSAGTISSVGNIVCAANISGINMTANSLTITSGTLSLANITLSGTLYANNITTGILSATGNVSTANIINSGNVFTNGVSASGSVTAASVSASGSITAASVSASGTVIAGNISVSNSISATGAIATGGAVLANSAVIANNINVSGSATFNNGIGMQGEFTTSGNINASTSGAFVSADAVYARTGNVSAGGYLLGDGRYISGLSTTATSISNPTGWSVTPSGTTLYFNYNGNNVGKLDSSGNFTVTGDVTAFGSV
jgi:hypothetical protein